MSQAARWAAMLALAFLGLSACSGSDDMPTPGATASVGASPAQTIPPSTLIDPPARPVDQATADGALKFIRYFWDTYNYAFATLDPSYLEAVSDPSCKFCSGTADDVRNLARTHGQIQGGEIKLLQATVINTSRPQDSTIRLIVSQRPGVRIAPSSTPVNQGGWTQVPSECALNWHDGKWHMAALAVDVKHGQPWSS